ncbi:biotin-dependent carboxyltransferase family protein [Aliiroseovarius sp. 2305UL8-7]|uniref:5-oxoprolinase subunit C family protein n=1 Tax=Aliiroseovarius conchicola TaxID=3121637 RepID=UPI00352882AF
MSGVLKILTAGPGLSIQDQGRQGWLDQGLSKGGAADGLALVEGAALLGGSQTMMAIEMAGMGGDFSVGCDIRIALTGAPMSAKLDGDVLRWNASHSMQAGARLSIGAVTAGNYGYLTIGAGFDTPLQLNARSAHFAAGIGRALNAGDTLVLGTDGGGLTGQMIDPPDRFSGGSVRIVESYQSALFSPSERERFANTEFTRGARANRMGIQLDGPAKGFHSDSGRSVVSDVTLPGDIQIAGDGTPFVLMTECQTTGGYPRIGTVVPCDMPKLAQTPAGAALRFEWVSLEQAVALQRADTAARTGLGRKVQPMIRDPRGIADLLSYQLISGVVAGDEE